MEDQERNHIKANMLELSQMIRCVPPLLLILKQHGVLSEDDLADLWSIRPEIQRSHKLLEIIQIRHGGYNALIEALEETLQSGAVAILRRINYRPSKSESTPQTQSSSSTVKADVDPQQLFEEDSRVRENILRNRGELLKLIDCNLLLLSSLVKNHILSVADLAVIVSMRFPEARVKSLLTVIDTRVGGYAALAKALEETSQTGALYLLRKTDSSAPESKGSSSSLEATSIEVDSSRFAEVINKITTYEQESRRNLLQEQLPPELFDFVDKGDKLNVNVRKPYPDEEIELSKSQYSTRKAYALILNIIKFTDKQDFRKGAQLDTNYMVELWEGLGFKIFPEDEKFRNSEEKSKDEIINTLANFRTKCVEDKVDCCVIFLGSHGFNDVIYASEGNTLDVYTDIIYPFQFSASNPKKRVAKIFINQSCQSNPPDNYSNTQPPRQPDVMDTFYVKAQIPKYDAYRDTTCGSYFVIVLTSVFMRDAHKKSLLDMLTEVQRLLKIVSSQDGDEYRQLCPLYQMDFLSPFYFFNTN